MLVNGLLIIHISLNNIIFCEIKRLDEFTVTKTFVRLSHIRKKIGINAGTIAGYIGLDETELTELERGRIYNSRPNKYAASLELYTLYLNRYLQYRNELRNETT